MEDEATIRAHQEHLYQRLRAQGLQLSTNKPRESHMESFLSRGDRKLAPVIERAWRLGAQFDAWGDQQDLGAWTRAFAKSGTDPDFYAYRKRSPDELFPWDVVGTGVCKNFLLEEYRHSQRGDTVDDCREQCYGCGVLTAFGGDWSAEWRCPRRGKGPYGTRNT
jgi:hypothetical protein